MEFGEQYVVRVDELSAEGLTAEDVVPASQSEEVCVTRLASTANEDYFEDRTVLNQFAFPRDKIIMFKVDDDCLIEITDTRITSPRLCRNRVGDIISFQFVSRVSRSEILGDTAREHSLGPAIICTAVRDSIMSYRVPKSGEWSSYVVVHTTLSNLLDRLGEDIQEYPTWLQRCIAGTTVGPVQRVLFSDTSHRDLVWTCFQLPVSGQLRKKWLTAKFWELLSIGLQSLKEDIPYDKGKSIDPDASELELLKRARRQIDREYADPPSLEQLSTRLGLSQTRLKSGFKDVFGMTVMKYCLQKRVDAAKLLLAERHLSVSQIADTVGYEDPSAFSRAFRRVTGSSPQEWRQAGLQEQTRTA